MGVGFFGYGKSRKYYRYWIHINSNNKSYIFLYQRGPNADIYFIVIIFTVLSIIGFVFSILSWKLSKHLIIFIVGLIGNGFVLVAAHLLLLAMGISEP